MVCEVCGLVAACPEWMKLLAVVGGVFLYSLVGALTWFLSKDTALEANETGLSIILGIFWPIVIIGFLAYLLGRWVMFPFIGATKEDLINLEMKLTSNQQETIDISKCKTKVIKPVNKFRVGDVVTGIKDQRELSGEPSNYEHLYEGCKCRVLSVDEEGAMRLILLGHRDYDAHSDAIGEVFKAPSRNFVLLKSEKSKKKRL